MKTISIWPFLIFALLVMLIEAARSAPDSKTVKVHALDLSLITFSEGGADDEDPL